MYCSCALLQLSWLYGNDDAPPERYPEILKRSSLQLGSDEFVIATLEEALVLGEPGAGMRRLLAFYEGLVYALCEVLETSEEELRRDIPVELLERLAAEVGVDLRRKRPWMRRAPGPPRKDA